MKSVRVNETAMIHSISILMLLVVAIMVSLDLVIQMLDSNIFAISAIILITFLGALAGIYLVGLTTRVKKEYMRAQKKLRIIIILNLLLLYVSELVIFYTTYGILLYIVFAGFSAGLLFSFIHGAKTIIRKNISKRLIEKIESIKRSVGDELPGKLAKLITYVDFQEDRIIEDISTYLDNEYILKGYLIKWNFIAYLAQLIIITPFIILGIYDQYFYLPVIFAFFTIISSSIAYYWDKPLLLRLYKIESFGNLCLVSTLMSKYSREILGLDFPFTYLVEEKDIIYDSSNLNDLLFLALIPPSIVNTLIVFDTYQGALSEKIKKEVEMPPGYNLVIIELCERRKCGPTMFSFKPFVESRESVSSGSGKSVWRIYRIVVPFDYSYIVMALGRILREITEQMAEEVNASIIAVLDEESVDINLLYFYLFIRDILKIYKSIRFNLRKIFFVTNTSSSNPIIRYLKTQTLFLRPNYDQYALQELIRVVEYSRGSLGVYIRNLITK